MGGDKQRVFAVSLYYGEYHRKRDFQPPEVYVKAISVEIGWS